ncbi:MAG: ATP-dependent helicase [Candidatus Omnitrophica bacterium]|nr:ATP-dependent helicase [Candidatus Omnitrophota bacterium]
MTAAPPTLQDSARLLEDLTATQRVAVTHEAGPLLIIAGAGTGKTTVITRRIAWLLAAQHAKPEEVLALTFTEKAAQEMEERVDLLVPYGYLDVSMHTFHAFGDGLLRDHAAMLGLSPYARVLSSGEQLVFLRKHLFELPLDIFRPLHDPARFVEALAAVFARAKDEAATPEDFLALAASSAAPPRLRELAEAFAAYQRLLRAHDLLDFGDQILLAIQLLSQHPDILEACRRRVRYLLVDEFQDTNYAQFRLLQLLAPPTANITVVADDDQSIYKWRGAALSNVLKFLDHYAGVRTVVLTENFRSGQPILDAAYRLIRFNDPDRLEVRQGIEKKLIARSETARPDEPHFHIFDTASSEADWVAQTIRAMVESGARRPKDIAILVRSNREADLFLRALNVAGIPWQFSGASHLFAREESKILLSCLKALADPDDSLSWYHVASSPLYRCRMDDLTKVLAAANRTKRSLQAVLKALPADEALRAAVSVEGAAQFQTLLADIQQLLEASRAQSPGQLLYRWLSDRGVLADLSRAERAEDLARLQTVARFFDHLRRLEEVAGNRLPDLMEHLELFQAMGHEPLNDEDVWADRVNVLTIHKAKGLEFPVVFLVGLVQGRFPTPPRKEALELPEALIQDILPSGEYHLQEERRLFYVGMTRAKEQLHLTCAYRYGGKSVRKVSQFVLEALDLPSPSPMAKTATAKELIERSASKPPVALAPARVPRAPLRLDPHGVDDYDTCPLKYRYSHVLRIPVMRHHLVVYGAALHKAVEHFFTRRLQGRDMTEAELLDAFDARWRAEGFLTREHEQLRLAQGRDVLRRFFARQTEAPEYPTLIEEKFAFPLEDLVVVGRWDRVDQRGDEAVIIDYKSSEVAEQAEANARARRSLQMLIYALAWFTLHGRMPARVELRFLDTDVIGQAVFDLDDLERARALLLSTASGIRAGEFAAQPDEFSCRWCAFQSICPSAFRPQ